MGLLGAAGASVILSACASIFPEVTRKPGQKAQLVYQDWRTDWFPPMARAQLEQFQDSHPNIRVYYTPDPDNLETKMLADMQTGTAADVFQGCCAHFPIWAQKGFCLDLRPYVKADVDRETIDDWDEAQYRSFFLRDGRQYAVPKYHGALALYFNKALFDRYGVPYPDSTWDHDDYREAMKRLTHDRDGDGKTDLWGSTLDVSWDRIQMHVNGWGGNFVDPNDPTQPRMGEEPAVAALRWLRERMWEDKCMATTADIHKVPVAQAFINGRVAMVEDGSWSLKSILAGAEFPLGIAPFPAGPVRRVTLATTDGFGIYSGTKHPDAAWELVKYLISKDYGRAMARANFLQPARRSLVEEWASYVRGQFPERTRDVNVAAFADGHVKGYSVTTEVFANQAEATRLATGAWDSILTLGHQKAEHIVEVSERIRQAQTRAQEAATACCSG